MSHTTTKSVLHHPIPYMTSAELFVDTLLRRKAGKVPLMLRDLTLGLDVLNVPTNAVFGERYDAELSARCVLALRDMMGSDVTMGCISTYSLEAFGGLTKYPSDGIPYVSGYPLADIDRLDEFQSGMIVSDLLKGMRRSCEIVKEQCPELGLCVNVPGPMTMAGFFRGVETLMMDVITEPDLAGRIVDFSVDVISYEMRFLYDGIADAVFLASATDNPDMIGDEAYRSLVLEGLRGLTEQAHSDDVPVIYHPHGVFSTDDRVELLNASLDTGIDGFQFSEGNEPSGILESCEGRCAVLGGVNAYSTLLLGPEKRIVRDTNRFLDELADHHYIMTCSCSVNRGLPLQNLKVMSDTLHAFNEGRE